MNNYLEMEVIEKNIKKYVVDILSTEQVKLFLPVTFIYCNGKIITQHKIEDMRPLKLIKNLSAEEAMDLLVSFCRNINEAEKHYLFFDDYDVDEDCIFVDKTYSEVRICFIPSAKGKSINEKIIDFILWIEKKMSEDGQGYMLHIKNFIEENHPGYSMLYRYICNLNREIYLCGIK